MQQYSVTREAYWKRIGAIGFLLAVFIIIRHNSSFYNYNTAAGEAFHRFLQNTITALAVPMFFIIAGFNFFRNYTPEKQMEKLRNRVKSLLIPYLVWNTVYCVFSIVTSYTAISRFFIGREKFVLTVPNVILGCLYHRGCNGHFWFVFVLMLIALLNPLFYHLLKNKVIGAAAILASYVLIFLLRLEFPTALIYRTDAFMYYLIGAYLAMHWGKQLFSAPEPEKGQQADPSRRSDGLLYGVALIGCSFLMAVPGVPAAVYPPIILLGCLGLWLLSGALPEELLARAPAGGTVFLLYAAHGILQPILVKLLYLALPKAPWVAWINFVLAIFLTVVLCVLVRRFLKRFLPPVDRVLTGWRR